MNLKNDLIRFKEYKKTYSNRKDLLKKIINVLKVRFSNVRISLIHILRRQKLNKEIKDRILNWKWYLYLKRKYKKVLNNLPDYKVPKNLEIPKIIWWCWLQGENNAPALCRSCLKSIKKNMPDYEIKIVTEENMWNLITVPDFIRKKYNKGIIPKTNFSDLLRACLLIEHGGIWMDSTVLCTGKIPKKMIENHFFIYQNYKTADEAICLSSWFIASCANEPSLIYTRDLLIEYWKRNNFLCHYFLFHFFFTMVCEKYPKILSSIPRYSNIPPHVLQFELFNCFDNDRWNQIKDISPFHKLTWKFDNNKIDIHKTYYQYILDTYKN